MPDGGYPNYQTTVDSTGRVSGLIKGYVDQTGNSNDPGFDSLRIAPGTFKLTWPAGTFAAPPIVVAMAGQAYPSEAVVRLANFVPTATETVIEVTDSTNGAPLDIGFYFIATG